MQRFDFNTGLPIGIPIMWTRQRSEIKYSRNGEYLISGGTCGNVSIWNAETSAQVGQPIQSPIQTGRFRDYIICIAISPGDCQIASAGTECIIRMSNFKGEDEVILDGHRLPILSLQYSIDGQYLISSGEDQKIKVWNIRQRKSIKSIKHKTMIKDIAICKNGYFYACASFDFHIRIRDFSIHKLMRKHIGHCACVTKVAFAPDHKTMASGSDDYSVIIWDIQTGRQVDTLRGHTQLIEAMALSKDGRSVISGSYDGTIRITNKLQ